ncbi:peptidoglycan DD-metalloendopeptidase family protein [Chelativorans sp. ZYF759]|uniref:peptidoglycan DD-metalloendopeptidase family protein n=1 Tax=Chelativorans sp. ZYF759 TaxID=2692213 RepID=UPI00145CFEFE|nr:peptidoglycan DD-metalloendopeptidase family protein [Chelativorans sp. ZYF759]NMG38566.1 peptidoglycan DD-metalloendopeptidase family protein [Chelativorans sp. ZYF759]
MTGSSRAPAQTAPAHQPFPGDVDQTYTGTVAQQPRRGGGILGRAGLTPTPAANVGSQAGMAVAAPQQQHYPQPVQSAPSGTISAGPALAPVSRSALDPSVTGSTQQVQQAQPLPSSPAPQATQPHPGGWSAQGGSRVTVRQGDTVAALASRYNVPEDALRQANGLSGGQQFAAGQNIVIPTFSQPGGQPRNANAPQPSSPQLPEPNQQAVLPQQPGLQERQGQASSQPGDGATTGAPAAGGTYKVVSGDTLSGISRRTGVSVDALKQANNLDNGLIRIGQELRIPAGGQVPQQTAQATPAPSTPAPVASAPAAGGQQQAATTTPSAQSAEPLTTGTISPQETAPAASGPSGLRWPVRGRVIAGFGDSIGGKTNDGIDISVPEGTAVRAAENGVVIYAGDGLREFGNTVLIRHDDGLVTVYGHNSRLNVSRGDTVRRGQEIALSGTSGAADTPRLHFEVRKDSTPVDPTSFLE